MPSKEYQVVRQISAIIAQTPSYSEGLRRATACIAERVQTDACSIFVYDEAAGRLVLSATHGLGQKAVGTLQLSPEQGITGYCFRTGETVNVARKTGHSAYHDFGSTEADRLKSLLAVPLTVGGRIIGVMDLERVREEAFPGEIVDMAHAIAAPLAVFILNASLTEAFHQRQAAGRGIRMSGELTAEVLSGKAIVDGVVRGRALVLPGAEMLDHIPLEYAQDIEGERELMRRALESAREETVQICREAPEILAEASGDIFSMHLMLFDDPTLLQRLVRTVDEGFTFRFGLKSVLRDFSEEMLRLDDAYMRERLADIKDVLLRIHQAADRIQGIEEDRRHKHDNRGRPNIIVTRELLPSQLVRVQLRTLGGIVCEEGGATAHAAILARSLRIPMLGGVEGALERIRSGDDLIVDCNTGICYLRPTPALVKKFRGPLALHRKRDEPPPERARTDPQTRDGTSFRLGGNISLISELPLLERYGARGVGLYRTEFMFMIRANYPSEEEQYAVFRRVVSACRDASATIRVLDVGGDKPLQYVDFGHEDNPFLGWRGIRFLLSNPQYFEPHLRAILRTTAHGRVNVLLPMVADVEELLAAKAIVERARESLRQEGLTQVDEFRLGIMIEVPSAVYALKDMLPHIDFASIGTNDLTQYTFAVDRGNRRVTQWYRQMHPVILGLIKQACDVVRATPGKALSICGEVAGMPRAVPLLMGIGLRYFSMNPRKIPLIRETIERLELPACEKLAEQALRCTADHEVEQLMEEFAREHGLDGTNA